MRAIGVALGLAAAGSAWAQAGPPRLGGTLVAGADRVAIFVAPTGTQTVVEGDTVGAFTVRRIARGRVELEGPQGAVVAVPAPVAEPTVPPGGWPVTPIPVSDK